MKIVFSLFKTPQLAITVTIHKETDKPMCTHDQSL